MRDKYAKYGYQEVITPQVYDVDLFHTSGHYENYRENMYFSRVDERDFSLKPNELSRALLALSLGAQVVS